MRFQCVEAVNIQIDLIVKLQIPWIQLIQVLYVFFCLCSGLFFISVNLLNVRLHPSSLDRTSSCGHTVVCCSYVLVQTLGLLVFLIKLTNNLISILNDSLAF